MANETTIDAGVARRLLLILSLEGDVKREEIEWALGIIHQIPGYTGITLAKAVQDKSLKDILVAIAAEQLSPTTPKDLETLIEDAQKRETALKSEKETGEKRAEEFIEAAEKAAKTKAQIKVPQVAPETPASVPETPAPTQPVSEGFSIRVSPRFIEKLGKKAVFAPFTVTRFLSPRLLQENPAVAASLATSIPLSELSKKAEGLPEAERVKILRFIEAINNAQYSTVAQMQLPMKIASIRGIQATLMESSEIGLPQGQAAAIIQTAKVSAPSLLGGLGRQVLGGIAQSAISKGVTKLATKAITTALGTAVAPGVGTAISLAVGWLVDKGKDLLSWMARNAPKVAMGLGAFLFGTGFVLNSGLLMGVGGLMGFGGLVGQAGGVGPALSQAGGFASSVIGGITSLTVASIATPLIVALISIPVLVAIILFIINSGAYLVPPKAPVFTGILESPYIAVDKKASPDCLNRVDPTGKPCPPLPGEITYEIEIKAKKGTLTNIKIENSYQVFGKGTGTIAPPKIETPQTISPTQPFRFSYKLRFEKTLDDSVVYDTLKITADAPEQKGAEASDVASVIIGNPPASSCPILGGTISTGSYNGTREVGHGSNSYWSGPAGEDCGYDIPAFTGCFSPTSSTDPDGNNVCQGKPRACSYYGFAADVRRSGADDIVQLPSIFGESINWTFQRRVTIAKTAWGWGYSFTGSDGKNNYSLYLGHLNQTTPPQTAPSGTIVGTLYPGLTPPHVHIELQINGQWVRPDFLCGGVGP